MSTWTIKPKCGTTEEWTASERVLETNEWGVEVTKDKHYILRIGNGKDKFVDLPAVVDTENLDKMYSEISNFKTNMQQATAASNTAAQEAQKQATAAQEATKKAEKLYKTEAELQKMYEQMIAIKGTIGSCIDGGIPASVDVVCCDGGTPFTIEDCEANAGSV